MLTAESQLLSFTETLCCSRRLKHWPWALRASQCPVLYTVSVQTRSNLHRAQVNAGVRPIFSEWQIPACWACVHSEKTGKSSCQSSGSVSLSSCWTLLLCLVSFRSETHVHTVWCEDVDGRKCVLLFFGLHSSSVHWRLVAPEILQLVVTQLSKEEVEPSSSNSPLLPTVSFFSICQCEMNYATFSFSHLLTFFDLWIHFVVCCSFCAVTYQKRKMFFSM